jgi:hypothetical protein
MQMYVFSKSISNGAQYVTRDSKIYCEKVSLTPHHLHYYTTVVVHLQSLSTFVITFSLHSLLNSLLSLLVTHAIEISYSCHFSIVMGVSCSFTYSTQHLQAMAMQPPSISHHTQMSPNCGLLSSVGMMIL